MRKWMGLTAVSATQASSAPYKSGNMEPVTVNAIFYDFLLGCKYIDKLI